MRPLTKQGKGLAICTDQAIGASTSQAPNDEHTCVINESYFRAPVIPTDAGYPNPQNAPVRHVDGQWLMDWLSCDGKHFQVTSRVAGGEPVLCWDKPRGGTSMRAPRRRASARDHPASDTPREGTAAPGWSRPARGGSDSIDRHLKKHVR